MEKKEAYQVYEEMMKSLGHLEDCEVESEPAIDVAKIVFAKFMKDSIIQEFKETLSDFDVSQHSNES